jgi:hypothetical protein
MTDFVLKDGDNIVINADTVVDDFFYEGGKIEVVPTVSFVRNGRFIFRPVDTDNVIERIYGMLIALVEIETGNNGIFSGFTVYDLYPQNKPLFFPCVVFGKTERENNIAQYLFGGNAMESLTIICDLAFKTGDHRTVGNIAIDRKDLADYYLTKMRELLASIVFNSDYIKIGNFGENSSIQEPQEPGQTLWGFSMEINMDYLINNAE